MEQEARLADGSLLLLQATERALLKRIQHDNQCPMTGSPCRDPAACGCFRETADLVLNES
jgi:hypothetical protein